MNVLLMSASLRPRSRQRPLRQAHLKQLKLTPVTNDIRGQALKFKLQTNSFKGNDFQGTGGHKKCSRTSTKLVLSSDDSMKLWKKRESKRSALITHLACPLTWRPKATTTLWPWTLVPHSEGPHARFSSQFFSCLYSMYCSVLLWMARELARKR